MSSLSSSSWSSFAGLLLLTLVPVGALSCSSGGSSGSGSGGTTGSGSGGANAGSGGSSGSGGAGTGSGGSTSSGSGGANAGSGGTAGGSGGAGMGGTDGGNNGSGGTVVGGTGQMFGTHKFQYPAGTIRPKGDADGAVAAFYDRWKAAYLRADCGGNYIFTGGGTGALPGTVEVSEGHGYGMVILPLMAGHDPNAQKDFDGLYTVFHKFGSINDPNLMSWSIQQGCKIPNGVGDFADSATDGDLDIAFGLVLADRQWGSSGTINYLAEAKKVIAAIKAHEVNPTTNLLMMGDWADIKAPYYAGRYAGTTGPYNGQEPHMNFYFGTRPSDFMMDHFRAFAKASGDQSWMTVVDAHHALVKKLTDGFASGTGLLPDFVEHTDSSAKPAGANYLESDADGRVGYNSCRVPWHLATDYIVSGDPRAKAEVDKINSWIKTKTSSTPAMIRDGYGLDGSTTGVRKVYAFEAPFAVASIVDASNQAWMDALWADMVTDHPAADRGYYDDTIKMLAILIMSGNWFAP